MTRRRKLDGEILPDALAALERARTRTLAALADTPPSIEDPDTGEELRSEPAQPTLRERAV